MPRHFRLVSITLAFFLFSTAGPALAQSCADDCSGGACTGGKCCKEPIVTWYVPAPPYPVYFGPPYPYTSYLQVHYVTPPAESALMVKQRLMFINAEMMLDPGPLPGSGQPQDPMHGNAPNTHGNAPAPAPQPNILPPPRDNRQPME